MKIMNKFQKKLANRKKDNKGFSLVELIIVIAIMAILVGIVGTQVLPYINKSKEAKDFQIINSYCTAATTAYSSYAEKTTAVTTIIIGGTNKDEDGKPAKTLEEEINTLTGYATISALTDKMGSKKGKTIKAVKIVINPIDDPKNTGSKTITAQAYSDTDCTSGNEVFDTVTTQL